MLVMRRLFLVLILALFASRSWAQTPASVEDPTIPEVYQFEADPETVEAPPLLDKEKINKRRAMDGSGKRGKPGYEITWYPSQSTNTGSNLGSVRQSFLGGVPIWKSDGDVVVVTAGVTNTLFSTDAILPDSNHPFPDQLWNVRFGMNYMKKFDNGWSGGLILSAGSASDKPFHSINELNGNIITFLSIPVWNERDSWMFSLMYSPVGNLNFPIPGIAYNWNPSENLNMSIGLPFSLMWKPKEKWTIELSYIPVTNVNALATYQFSEQFSFYGGYQWTNEAYLLANRSDYNDRFIGFEQRLISGMRWNFWTNVGLDVKGGYVFDRSYGITQNQLFDLQNRIEIDPGAFLGMNLFLQF